MTTRRWIVMSIPTADGALWFAYDRERRDAVEFPTAAEAREFCNECNAA